MKRYGNLWKDICSMDNVNLAIDLALNGKKVRPYHTKFLNEKEILTNNLYNSLVNETYTFSKPQSFFVYEPKQRIIHHAPFYPDKILHHCLMNIIKPIVINNLTYDTYGSIKGRGIHMLIDKLNHALKDKDYNYYLKIDIKKFYDNIDHQLLKNLFTTLIKCKKTLKMINDIIDSHNNDRKIGLPIGYYTSQYFANFFLSKFDHFIKEELHIKYYFRYMDDMVFLFKSKEEAQESLTIIKRELEKINLTLNKNIIVAPIDTGIDFVGYKFFKTHILLRKKIKQRMKKCVNNLFKQQVNDKIFKEKTASYYGWCKHGNCRHLLKTILKDKIYLYRKQMEIKRLSDIRKANNWFALDKNKRISITELYDKEVILYEYIFDTIKGVEKTIVKFAYEDNPEDYHYFITRSEVIRDRLQQDKEILPFIASLKKIKNYVAYE